MDYDLFFLGGLGLILLAFVSFIGAWTESRRPVIAIIFVSTGIALLIFVARDRPQGLFELKEVPEIVTRVIARLLALL
ncbi:MAG: hypothetical protein JJU24_00480 [Natronohydrobacter sp.]|nr:hypothetical protein [Natronohydrobacter sp.]